MKKKIQQFVKDRLDMIPDYLPEDEIALELATVILHDRTLVPNFDGIGKICGDLTELGVHITCGLAAKPVQSDV